MNVILSISSIVLFVLSILFGMYEVKKGQIKMRDNQIPSLEVNFRRRPIL